MLPLYHRFNQRDMDQNFQILKGRRILRHRPFRTHSWIYLAGGWNHRLYANIPSGYKPLTTNPRQSAIIRIMMVPNRRLEPTSLTPCSWETSSKKTVLARFPSPRANAHIIGKLHFWINSLKKDRPPDVVALDNEWNGKFNLCSNGIMSSYVNPVATWYTLEILQISRQPKSCYIHGILQPSARLSG